MSIDLNNINFLIRNIEKFENEETSNYKYFERLKDLSLYEFLILIDNIFNETEVLYTPNSRFARLLNIIPIFYYEEGRSHYYSENDLEELLSMKVDEFYNLFNNNDNAERLISHFSEKDIIIDDNHYVLRSGLHPHANPYYEAEEGLLGRGKDFSDEEIHIGATYMSYIREIHYTISKIEYPDEIIKLVFDNDFVLPFYSEIFDNTIYEIISKRNQSNEEIKINRIKINKKLSKSQLEKFVKIYFQDYTKFKINQNKLLTWLTEQTSAVESKTEISKEDLETIITFFKFLNEKKIISFKTLPFSKLLEHYFNSGITHHRIKQLYQKADISDKKKLEINKLIKNLKLSV